jgi:preprotein translocase subunit SecF
MQILKYKNVFLGVAAVMVVASLVTILMNGFKQSIDFTGGSKVVFTVNSGTINNDGANYEAALKNVLLSDFGEVKLNKISENATSTSFSLSTRSLAEADYAKLQNSLKVGTGTVGTTQTQYGSKRRSERDHNSSCFLYIGGRKDREH